jgi:mono/diheme cytochrome c family protein
VRVPRLEDKTLEFTIWFVILVVVVTAGAIGYVIGNSGEPQETAPPSNVQGEIPKAHQGQKTTTGKATGQTTTGQTNGEQLFTSTCGSCHTLAAAGTSGTVGPNLDELKPTEQVVLNAIQTGPGTMPPGLYSGADAQAVAKYVAQNAGK